jgi:signal transduction histidine kinase
VSAREWLRQPGHLLVAFLVVTLLPACVLGVLGWRLFQQDVALESQYLQDRLEHAADRAVAALDGQLSRLQDTLASTSELPTGNDVVRVAFGPGSVEATPADRLLYYPPSVTPVSLPTQPFLQGEALEFGQRDAAAAATVFRKLTKSRDPTIRAGALLRLARALRSSGRGRDALAVYDELARLGTTPVGAGPAELVARRARSEVLLALGRRDEADRETKSLLTDLQGGRWKLDRTTFEFHAQGLSNRLEKPASNPPDALALSAAVSMLWERYQGLGAGDTVSEGRQSIWIDGHPMLVVWKGTRASLNALAAGDGFLRALWQSVPTPAEAALTLTDAEGHVVLGDRAAQPGPLAVRPAADTGLPWTIKIAPVDPASESGRASARRFLLFAGLALLSLLVAGAGAIVWRATARELAVAELQSDFVSAVSHEFRTPLTSMRHLTELLEDGVVTSEAARGEYYSLLSQETRRLHRLVEALLNFARMESGRYHFRLAPTDPGRLTADVVEEFKRESVADEFSVEVDASVDLECQIDRESLSLAIWNLLENAVKYSGQCRTIRVAVERRGDRAAISVRDSGLGIAPREQKAIFEKFVRGDSARASDTKGAGLGLALVRRIVEGHGGTIEVESELERGSTFTILLPTGRGQEPGARIQGSPDSWPQAPSP